MNKLTIIIPCYNCEETLGEAVNSIYKQGLNNFEIIMVNDASTDNTFKLMTELQNKYSEIKIFQHNENKGGGAARNTAVKNSVGDAIFCLDSDDILPPKTLSKMYKYLLENKCDGVAIHKVLNFNNVNIKDISHIYTSPYPDKKIPFDSLFSKEIGLHPLFVNFMYTRNAFDKLGGYPTSHGFDTQGFCFRFLCSGLEAYTCPDTEYLLRINFKESYYLNEHNNGKTNYNLKAILLEHSYIFTEKALDFIEKFNCKDFTKNIFDELKKTEDILKPNFQEEIMKHRKRLEINIPDQKNVKINSLEGKYFRLRNKIKKIVKCLYKDK